MSLFPTEEEVEEFLKEMKLEFPDINTSSIIIRGTATRLLHSQKTALARINKDFEKTDSPANTDPKGEAGADKCPLWLIPPQPMEETAFVHGLGAIKYGPWNWRKNKVCASTYISAILRHLNAWRSGEDKDPESGRSHLAHIAAGCFILMDAALFGNLIDDRAK